MIVSIIPGRELCDPLVQRWRELQRSNLELCSPFFSPEFTSAIALARDGVEIAVVEERGKIVAFFPFQRETRNVGKPVGFPLSDYQGLVCEPSFQFDPTALLRACKLSVWDYDHLLATQTPFVPYHQQRDNSPIIKLAGGFDNYIREHKIRGSGLRIPLQLMRKLEREVGPLEFKHHVSDIGNLHFIMNKKSEQYKRTDRDDLFSKAWIKSAVENVFRSQTTEFGGMLSVIFAGAERVCALMSIRSIDVCHAWFFGFEDRFSRYSPGFVMYLKLVECGFGLGFRYLDFGKGDQPYKKRLMNDSIAIASGSVEIPSFVSFFRHANRKVKAAVRESPLAGPAHRLVNWFRGKQSKLGND